MSHWENNIWWWQLDASYNASHFIEPQWLLDWDINRQREETIWDTIEALQAKAKICFCWETMNWYWDGAHCPNGCIFLEKPDHNLWWNSNVNSSENPIKIKEPFQETVLETKNNSSLNKTKNDGKVILYGFEKQWSKLIFSINIQLRWEWREYMQPCRKWWNKWIRDGEIINIPMISKWRKMKKNIRIHLTSGDSGYHISNIFSWRKKDNYQYTQMWDGWYLWEEQDPTFDKTSIKNIAEEAYDIYKAYMAE